MTLGCDHRLCSAIESQEALVQSSGAAVRAPPSQAADSRSSRMLGTGRNSNRPSDNSVLAAPSTSASRKKRVQIQSDIEPARLPAPSGTCFANSKHGSTKMNARSSTFLKVADTRKSHLADAFDDGKHHQRGTTACHRPSLRACSLLCCLGMWPCAHPHTPRPPQRWCTSTAPGQSLRRITTPASLPIGRCRRS